MDPPLIKLDPDCAHVSGGYWRAITDVVFGEVFGAGDEGGWRLTGHKECAGVEGVADGDMTEAIEYRVVIENMVGCDKCREDGGYVDCNHCWIGSVVSQGREESEGMEMKGEFGLVEWVFMLELCRRACNAFVMATVIDVNTNI